ncbi:hypothetical protein BLA29_003208 [Euroglyphus maynei]|uniref:Uncharacterized protein n=1 Tax=Euroglyphus maynei TaxID=6958 RepID=A0A1Y3AY70_EURMA|nr:hypothetical protein BLA29_003208 [Euroglyphus maynei]
MKNLNIEDKLRQVLSSSSTLKKYSYIFFEQNFFSKISLYHNFPTSSHQFHSPCVMNIENENEKLVFIFE